MTSTPRQRPTVAAMKLLEEKIYQQSVRIKELETGGEVPASGTEVEGYENKIQELEAAIDNKNARIMNLQQEQEGATDEIEAKLKDAQEVMAQASARIKDLETQLDDALEGKDHSQGEDLPPVEEGRIRYFTDLTRLHSDYLVRVASREGRTPCKMIERIIRIDRANSPDKGGAIDLTAAGSLPAADAPQIPITK